MRADAGTGGCGTITACAGWIVISNSNEGLNAAADINHDEIVNATDIGLLVAAWGDAPRNDDPPSDCPVGLFPEGLSKPLSQALGDPTPISRSDALTTAPVS